MPLYEFKCRACGTRYIYGDRDHIGEPCTATLRGDFVTRDGGHSSAYRCSGQIKRLFSFSTHMDMPDHFNTSTNSYVRNRSHFSDELKRMSEDATHYTGIEHNYTPVDYHDTEAIGVTPEGLDATYDKAREEGRPAIDPDTI